MGFWEWLRAGGDYVLVVCGVVTAVCVAGNWVYKIIKRARQPHENLKQYVEELADKHDEYDEYFERDKERLDRMEVDQRLTLRAIMQLITHEVDGNHVDKLRSVRDEIQHHLIERT